METVRFDHVSKSYGSKRVLRDISFTLNSGETVALLGRNGAGKSTIMNMLTGFIAPTSGTITICGKKLENNPSIRQKIGYLPENPPLYNDMTVREYLRYCAEIKNVDKKHIRDAVDTALANAQLNEYADILISQLSKGYRQRTGVAQAVVSNPGVLVLDEPANGLDPLQLVQMRSMLTSINNNGSAECTILLSSHMLSQITDLATRAIITDGGEIVFDGSMSELTRKNNSYIVIVKSTGSKNPAQVFDSVDGVTQLEKVSCDEENCVRYRIRAQKDVRRDIITKSEENGIYLLEIMRESDNLETAFLSRISK